MLLQAYRGHEIKQGCTSDWLLGGQNNSKQQKQENKCEKSPSDLLL